MKEVWEKKTLGNGVSVVWETEDGKERLNILDRLVWYADGKVCVRKDGKEIEIYDFAKKEA